MRLVAICCMAASTRVLDRLTRSASLCMFTYGCRSSTQPVIVEHTTNKVSSPGTLGLVADATVDVMGLDGQGGWVRCNVLAVGGGAMIGSMLQQLFNSGDDWGFRHQSGDKGSHTGLRLLEPYEFSILELRDHDQQMQISKTTPLVWRDTRTLRQGEALSLFSSPFGALSPQTFLNSVTTGVVSNVVQNVDNTDAMLVLTDARCLPCSDGGPVVDNSDELIGLILPPLERQTGQTVGFTPIVPMVCLQPFLEAVETTRRCVA